MKNSEPKAAGMLATLRGNTETVAALQTALAGGALPHAVLLAGPNGCGRNHMARCLAADYLYPDGGEGARAVMAGESSEVLLAEGEGKSGQIPIARIRAVRSDIFHSALSAAGRVVHIRDAHHMAAPAANALLKVLEEPPADALFILTAQSTAALPATIVSRCAVYPVGPLEVGECRELLQSHLPPGADAALPGLLAALYGGRAGLGLSVLGSAARLATAQDALAAAKAAGARNQYALLRIFARYEGRAEEDRERRTTFLADMGDALAASLRGQVAEGLPQLPPAAAAMLLRPVANAQNALAGNAAPKITFTALAVNIARAGME